MSAIGKKSFAAAAVASMVLCAPGAWAQQQQNGGDLIVDGRLRYEHVDQDGLTDADAVTLRLRLGYEQELFEHFKVLGEIEGVALIGDDFADTVRARPGQAVVLDPEALEVNRLQAQWTNGGFAATLGRQRIILNNARFVGNVGFRQNEQTFDALRVTYRANENLNFNYIYVDRVRRILGDDSPNGEWRSDSHIGQADLKTGFGDFSGYGLLLDFENAAAQSTQTYGLRWTKTIAADPFRFTLGAEAATQSDYGNSPTSFDLNYYAANAGAQRGQWRFALAGEVLEGNGARGFATPLATLHAFQGWADVFLTTPADGIRDLNGSVSWTDETPPFGRALTMTARYHDFASDDGDTNCGSEVNAVANWRIDQRWSLEAKAAFFDGEDPRFADRNKIWLAVELSL
ncbi:MAG TPA: hypothetical protein DHW63_07780 [Hyphomonadaceae bacterium]|nr:hypothetical protein [Hyphomonadaceae bacterium]